MSSKHLPQLFFWSVRVVADKSEEADPHHNDCSSEHECESGGYQHGINIFSHLSLNRFSFSLFSSLFRTDWNVFQNEILFQKNSSWYVYYCFLFWKLVKSLPSCQRREIISLGPILPISQDKTPEWQNTWIIIEYTH